jgi:hypothetical protein
VLRPALVALSLVLLLAACGGGSSTTPATKTTASAASAARASAAPAAKPCPRTQKALAKIRRDVAAIRAAAKLPTKSTLIGNRAINAATDRFLNDVMLAPIANLQRNRLIDLAASALVGNCEQCFQALEANRPIPAIRQGDLKCAKQK